MSDFTLYQSEPNDLCSCNSGVKFRFCCFRNVRIFEEAVEFADNKQFDRALEILDRAETLPGSGETHGMRALVYLRMKRRADAEREIEAALAVNADYPRGYALRANLLIEDNKLEEARALLDRAISLLPPECSMFHAEFLLSKGFTQLHGRNFAGAKETWCKAVKLDPGNDVTANVLIRYIYDNPDVPEDIARKDMFYFENLAGVMPMDELFEGEEDLDDETIKEIDSLMAKADHAAKKGKPKKAVTLLEEALDLYPRNGTALITLFQLYFDMGDMENALPCLYELAEFTEDPEEIHFVFSNTTTFEFLQHILPRFPMIVAIGKEDGPSKLFLTSSLPIANIRAAESRFDDAGEKYESYNIKKDVIGNRIFFHFSQKKSFLRPNPLSFNLRFDLNENTSYLDSMMHDNFHEFIHLTKRILGETLAGEPGEPVRTVLCFPAPPEEDDIDPDDAFEDGLESLDPDKPASAIPSLRIVNGDDPGEDGEDDFEEDEIEDLIGAAELVPFDEFVVLLNEAIDEFFDEWIDEPRAELAYMTPVEAAEEKPYCDFMADFMDTIEDFITGVIPPDILKFNFDGLRGELVIPPEESADE